MESMTDAFGKANSKARSIRCVSNVRQLGLGFYMYVSETGKTFPWDFGRGQFWMQLLRAHYGNVDKVRICPETREQPLQRMRLIRWRAARPAAIVPARLLHISYIRKPCAHAWRRKKPMNEIHKPPVS